MRPQTPTPGWLEQSVRQLLDLPPSEPLPPTLTVEQVAAVYGISKRLAYDSIRAGEIPSLRFGAKIVCPTAKVLDLLYEGSQAGAGSKDQPRPLLLEARQ